MAETKYYECGCGCGLRDRIPWSHLRWETMNPQQRREVKMFWQSPLGIDIKRMRRDKENKAYMKRLRYAAAGKNRIHPNAEYFDGETWRHDRPKQSKLEGF